MRRRRVVSWRVSNAGLDIFDTTPRARLGDPLIFNRLRTVTGMRSLAYALLWL